MRGNRLELLLLIEQRPRRVRELAALTNMTVSAIYEALRQYKALGVVQAQTLRGHGTGFREPKIYALPGADLSAFA